MGTITEVKLRQSVAWRDLTVKYIQYQQADSDTENYLSVWHQTHYDVKYKNINVSFEYILSLVSDLLNTSDYVCLPS